MKRFLALLLALIMIFSFSACGEEKKDIGMPNPVTEVESLSALNEELGVKLCAPGVMGVTDVVYQIIDCGDYKIGEYKFNVNSLECDFRASAIYDQDISGYHNGNGTAFESYDLPTDLPDYVISEEAMLARWATIDGQYVLNIKNDGQLEVETFESIVSELEYLTKPGMSDSETQYFYQSLAGAYQDKTSQRATANIVYDGGDSALVTVGWSSSASEYTEWTMTIRLTEDGLLSYNDEKCTNYVYSESGDPASYVDYENKDGFFAQNEEGNLCWLGAATQSCTECVFEKIPE